MTVKKYQSGRFILQPSLLAAIGAEQPEDKAKAYAGGAKPAPPVISVVGAGGKTTTIRRLAEEYAARGIPVIVTTTTHMMAENYPWFLLEPSLKKVGSIIEKHGMVWVGVPDKSRKMAAPPLDFMNQLFKCGCPIIIEADGAKMLPMKAPAGHEPVLLPETTHVVNVYGLDALGMALEHICFRAELAAKLLNKKTTDYVQAEDIVTLALNKQGGRKGILPGMNYHVILNKADTPQMEEAAKGICRLAEIQGFTELTVTGNENMP